MNKIQKITSLVLLGCFHAFGSSAQDQSPQVQQLLSQRAVLAAENQSYADLEKEIVGLGQFPPALVTKTVADGKAQFNFTTYKDIRPESEVRVAERIRASIPEVASVSISNRQIQVVFTAAATEANVNDFFKLMGYTSYEIKTN